MTLNKLFFILFLPLAAVAGGKEPKFMKGQKVNYKVPKFYSLVCTGKGRIERYDDFNNTYTIEEDLHNDDCPDMTEIPEKDIQAIE